MAPERLVGPGEALAWFTAERPALVAAIAGAATSGFDTHCWQIASVLTEFCHRQGMWQDVATVNGTALDAAERGADRAGEAHAHLGLAAASLGPRSRPQDAYRHLRRALDLFGQLGDQAGQARAHYGLGWMFVLQGRHEEALQHAQRALDLYDAVGDLPSHAAVLNAIGWVRAQLGDYRRALECCQRALVLVRETGNLHDEGPTLDSIAYAHHRLGHLR